MRVVPTDIPGILIVEPAVHVDGRGFFLETYHADRYREHGIDGPFVQDNHSKSFGGTLRGLHMQLRRPQGKLVRVVNGEIFDAAVDVRPGSATFGRWVGVTLSADNFRQLYIPPGFAHGFCVMSPIAEVEYKCTTVYDRSDEIGIAWNDPALAIRWPIDLPTLSARDQQLPQLADILDQLAPYRTEP